jgi:hypothetical protein
MKNKSQIKVTLEHGDCFRHSGEERGAVFHINATTFNGQGWSMRLCEACMMEVIEQVTEIIIDKNNEVKTL